jgi:hypothetical protein
MGIIRNAIIGVAGIGIVSAGVLAFDSTTRDDAGQIVEAGSIGVFSFEVGDCLNDIDSQDETVSEALGVPCEEPHYYEVYFETFLEGETRLAIKDQADDYCLENFNIFVGMQWEDSELNYTSLFPTIESYEEGDREITCMLYRDDERLLIGSAKGTGW